MGMSGDRSKHFDIVAETRRIRSDEEKRAIVAEASNGYRNVSAVARRHGIKPSLLFRWKKQFSVCSSGTGAEATAFVPVTLALPGLPPMTKPSGAPVHAQSMMEIEVAGGRKLRVGTDIDIAVLKRIMAALETV